MVDPGGNPTMGVDKFWRLYYHPSLNWTPLEAATVLYHEIMHLLRDHMARGEAHDKVVWNIAGDAEINDDIVSEQMWSPPGDYITPGKIGEPDGQLAEYYYAKLMENAQKCQNGQCSHKKDGNGNCQSPSGGQGKGKEKGDQKGDGQGSGEAGNDPMNGGCGSSATGGSEDDARSKLGDEAGARKIGHAESELIARKTAEEIQQNKSIGTMPGHWAKWADRVLKPIVDWKKELRAQIVRAVSDIAGQVDYSYKRPSRRTAAVPDIVLPSMRQPVVTVDVVVDTSGSMGKPETERAIAEVGGILKALGVRDGVRVLSVDAAVHAVQKVFRAEQIKPIGGGGTNMGVGIEHASELRPKSDIIVVLTDGYTPWPQKPPQQKVVVGIIHGTAEGVPYWAKTVVIRDAETN